MARITGYGVGAPNIRLSPPPIVAQRAPTTSDTGFEPGQPWIDQAGNASYVFIEAGSGGASWAQSSSASGSVTTLTGNSGGALSPSGGNINIVGASGTTVAGAGSTLTITATPQSFTWNPAATSIALAVENGYIVEAGAQSFSLPATAAVGDEIALMLHAGTSWTITQGGGQSIRAGSSISTTGVGGSVASTAVGDSIWLICTTANTDFMALSFVGALNVV